MRRSQAVAARAWNVVAALALIVLPYASDAADAADASDSTLHFTKPVVLLGEVHDNAGQHALRLRAFEEWLQRGARPALLMEQFDHDQQASIDRAMKGAGSAGSQPPTDEVIDAGAPGRIGWNWSFYRPFVDLALRYGLPIVAVNVGRDEARGVIALGLAAHGFDDKVPPAVLTGQATAIEASHCGLIGPEMARRMAQAQIARDQFMARSVEANADRGALLLAGNGHVRNDIGVPTWLHPSTRARTETIGMLEPGDAIASAYDRVLITAAQTRADPCGSMQTPQSR